MSRVFRVAVLECDTPLDDIKTRRGTYGDIFRDLLQRGLDSLDYSDKITLEVSKWDVITAQEYPDLDAADGILLTGSKHNSFESDPWILKLVDFVKTAFEKQKLLVGICFGHQVIARAMGVPVGRNPDGWEISAEKFDLTATGSALMGGKSSLNLHQMHRDVVFEVPKGFENLGSSPRCKVQGLYLPKRVLTTQAHPEFSSDIMNTLLTVRHDQKVFDDQLFADGMARASLEHDGVLVAGAIWRFYLDL